MKLLCVLFILIDLLVLWKLLDHKEKEAEVITVTFKERPRRVIPAVTIPVVEEEDFEEIKEALRIKFEERRKAWEREYLWNAEDNLRKFRLKNGISIEGEGYTKGISKYEDGLFSLSVV